MAEEANKRNNNWLPPPWAIAALLILGFNEFMTLLRNPLYLLVLFVAFLLGKALWVQLDITGEFRNGALPGLLSLSTKFVPTVLSLLKKLAEQAYQPASSIGSRGGPPIDSKSFQNVPHNGSRSIDSKSFQNVPHNGSRSSDASSDLTSVDSGEEQAVL